MTEESKEKKPETNDPKHTTGTPVSKGIGEAAQEDSGFTTGTPIFFDQAPRLQNGRLPPFLDAIYTDSFSKEKQSERNYYYEVAENADANLEYTYHDAPVREIAEDNQDNDFITSVTEGANAYGNLVVKALNNYVGTDINDFTQNGDLDGISEWIEQGGFVPILGLMAGGGAAIAGGLALGVSVFGGTSFALEVMDNSIQATREKEDFEQNVGLGLSDWAWDWITGNAKKDRQIIEHFALGEVLEGQGALSYSQKLALLMFDDVIVYAGTLGLGKALYSGLKVGVGRGRRGAVGFKDASKKTKKSQLSAAEESLKEKAERMAETPELKELYKNEKLTEIQYGLSRQKAMGDLAIHSQARKAKVAAAAANVVEEAVETTMDVKSLKGIPPRQAEPNLEGMAFESTDKVLISKPNTWDEALDRANKDIDKFLESPEGMKGSVRRDALGDKNVLKEDSGIRSKLKEMPMKERHQKGVLATGSDTIASKQTLQDLIEFEIRIIEKGAGDETLSKLDALIAGQREIYSRFRTRHGGNMAKMAVTNRLWQLVDIGRETFYKEVRGAKDSMAIQKAISRYRKFTKAHATMGENLGLPGEALLFLTRSTLNNYLSKGALITTLASNSVAGIYETIKAMAKDPRDSYRLMTSVGTDSAKAIIQSAKPKEWHRAWKRVVRGEGGGLAEEDLNTISQGLFGKGKLGKAMSTATGTNFILLTLADDAMQMSLRSVISKDAIRDWALKRMKYGASSDDVINELKHLIKHGQMEDASLTLSFVNAFDEKAKRLAMRADKKQAFAPLVSLPLWAADETLRNFKLNYPTMGALVSPLTIFSRVGANVVDYYGRNSALRFIDAAYYKMIGTSLSKNDLMDAAIGTGVNTVAGIYAGVGLSHYLYSFFDSEGNHVLQQGSPYAASGESRQRALSFRHKEGVYLAGQFVEYRRLGTLGYSIQLQRTAVETIQRQLLRGDFSLASRTTDTFLSFVNALYGEEWFSSRLLAFLTYVRRDAGQGREFELADVLDEAIPLKGEHDRLMTFMRKAQPSGHFQEMFQNLDDELSVQVNPFGRQMRGIDNLTNYMEGSESHWDWLQRFYLFVDPTASNVYDRKTSELTNFLLATGGFTNHNVFYYKPEGEDWKALPKNFVEGDADVAMRRFLPTSNYEGKSFPMSQVDENQARILLSLDEELIERVLNGWNAKIKRMGLEHELVAELDGGEALEAFRELRQEYVDMGMEGDMTDFMHRIATAPLGQLNPQVAESVRDEIEFLQESGLVENNVGPVGLNIGELDPRFVERLARKNVIARLWENNVDLVNDFTILSPSALEQLVKLAPLEEDEL